MDVTDTKHLEKICSKCGIKKNENMFIPKRNICKECRNKKSREKYKVFNNNKDDYKICNTCSLSKTLSLFIKNRNICKECNNNKRRDKYKNNEEHRIKSIKQSNQRKQKIRETKIQKYQQEIGVGNIKCRYCMLIKPKDRFRHNRLKCKDCERDEPISKIIRSVRSRIISTIKSKNKNTIAYLGCNCVEYLKWILHSNNIYTYENYGKEWHIDHVIPLSRFNILDEKEQLIAFNWRNTMPLSVKENLSKNNKILPHQIETHLKSLKQYHEKYNIEFPQEYNDLFAKHLDAGNPLESFTTTS